MSQTFHPIQKNESEEDYSTGVQGPAGGSPEQHLIARVEALLFVSTSPVTIGQLAGALRVSPKKVERAIEYLISSYTGRGIRIQRHSSGMQLTAPPELADDIERFLHLESTARLSRAALEVLSIVAYQQPVTRPQIDSIRGVNSDSVLRTLLRHGLLEEIGRSDGPGRPILYATTSEFLQHFGINSIEELPSLQLDPLPDAEETDSMGNAGSTD